MKNNLKIVQEWLTKSTARSQIFSFIKISITVPILTVVAGLTVILVLGGCGDSKARSDASDPEGIIAGHVKKRFGSDCKVDIQGGFSGGSYQVQVYIPVTKPEFAGQMKTPDGNYGYDRKNFVVLLNDSKNKVKSMDRY